MNFSLVYIVETKKIDNSEKNHMPYVGRPCIIIITLGDLFLKAVGFADGVLNISQDTSLPLIIAHSAPSLPPTFFLDAKPLIDRPPNSLCPQ